MRKRFAVACQRAVVIRRLCRTDKKRRIAYDAVIPLFRFELLQGTAEHPYSLFPRTCLYILPCLFACFRVDFQGIHGGLRVSLGCHQGNDSRSRTDVQNSSGVFQIRPCSQQHTVRSHLHGGPFLVDGELFEPEHFRLIYSLRNSATLCSTTGCTTAQSFSCPMCTPGPCRIPASLRRNKR